MKKYFALLLVLLSMFMLVACSSGYPSKEKCEDLVVEYLTKTFNEDVEQGRIAANAKVKLVQVNSFSVSNFVVGYNIDIEITENGSTSQTNMKGYVAHKSFEYSVYYASLNRVDNKKVEAGDSVYYGNMITKNGEKIIPGRAGSINENFKTLDSVDLTTKLTQAFESLSK